MIPIKNEAVCVDNGALKKAEHMLSEILHEKGPLLKENKEIWKSLITLRTWLKKALECDNSAVLQIRSYADKLIAGTAEEIHARAEDEQRMESESPSLPEKAINLKSVQYFEAYNELTVLREWMEKHQLIGDAFTSIPVAV